MKKWLPTALLITGIVVLASFFVAIRLLLTPAFANHAESLAVQTAPVIEPAPASQPAADSTTLVPVPPAGSPVDALARPVSPGVRFVSRVIEPSYVVVPGDNLWSIAQRHNTTADALQAFNNLDRPALSVGQRLVIP